MLVYQRVLEDIFRISVFHCISVMAITADRSIDPPTLHRFTILHLKRLNDIFHSHLAGFTSHLALLEPRCDQATAKNLRCAYLTAGHKEVELPVELPDLWP